MDQSSEPGPRTSAPSEWASIGEFSDGGYYVKVNRAKGSRKFSLEIGGLARDGRTMRYVPMVWSMDGGIVEMDPSLDPSKLMPLVTNALDLVKDTMAKEGPAAKRR